MPGALKFKDPVTGEVHTVGMPKVEDKYVETTMMASGWVDGKYSFEDVYPHAKYNIEVAVADSATAEQFEAAGEAMIGSSATSNIFTARGDVPTVDIPVVVKVVAK